MAIRLWKSRLLLPVYPYFPRKGRRLNRLLFWRGVDSKYHSIIGNQRFTGENSSVKWAGSKDAGVIQNACWPLLHKVYSICSNNIRFSSAKETCSCAFEFFWSLSSLTLVVILSFDITRAAFLHCWWFPLPPSCFFVFRTPRFQDNCLSKVFQQMTEFVLHLTILDLLFVEQGIVKSTCKVISSSRFCYYYFYYRFIVQYHGLASIVIWKVCAAAFHRLCDNKGATFVVTWAKNGRLRLQVVYLWSSSGGIRIILWLPWSSNELSLKTFQGNEGCTIFQDTAVRFSVGVSEIGWTSAIRTHLLLRGSGKGIVTGIGFALFGRKVSPSVEYEVFSVEYVF
jgi:hypothetical protein